MRTPSEVVASLLLGPASRLLQRRSYRLSAVAPGADSQLSVGVYKPLVRHGGAGAGPSTSARDFDTTVGD